MILLGMGIGEIAKSAFRFGVSELDYQQIQRQFDYRWQPQNRVGRRPAMQFTGPGEETVSLDGTIFPKDPRFGGHGWNQLQGMRTKAMAGTPMPIASSLGVYHGVWCVKSISDGQSEFHVRDGNPQKVRFTISLTHYGPDQMGLGGFLGGFGGLGSLFTGMLSGGALPTNLLPNGLSLSSISTFIQSAMPNIDGVLQSAVGGGASSSLLSTITSGINSSMTINVEQIFQDVPVFSSLDTLIVSAKSSVNDNVLGMLTSAINDGDLTGSAQTMTDTIMANIDTNIVNSVTQSLKDAAHGGF